YRSVRAHAVDAIELVHQTRAFDAESRLQRAGGIVEPGVDDTAVVELVSRPDADAVRVRTPSVRAARWRRRGEAADAGADYRDVNLCHVRAPTAAIRESTRTARRCGPAAADESSARD